MRHTRYPDDMPQRAPMRPRTGTLRHMTRDARTRTQRDGS